ncbi:MAG: hypothetical protein SGJ02_03815 [bacterium]|nr:hypothetical protein [bacterium]
MGIEILFARVDRFQIISSLVVVIALLAAPALFAEDDSAVFFDKNYANSQFEELRDQKNGLDIGKSNSKKVQEYQEKLKEEEENLKENPSLNTNQKTKVNPNLTKEIKTDRIKEFETTDQNKETEKEVSSSAEPISISKFGELSIISFVSAEPHQHLFNELDKLAQANNKEQVVVKEITIIGKPFSSPDFAKSIKKFNPKKTVIKFLLKLPEGAEYKYSPSWKIVAASGEFWIFEGEFKLAELLAE